jgi:hypothetical protein
VPAPTILPTPPRDPGRPHVIRCPLLLLRACMHACPPTSCLPTRLASYLLDSSVRRSLSPYFFLLVLATLSSHCILQLHAKEKAPLLSCPTIFNTWSFFFLKYSTHGVSCIMVVVTEFYHPPNGCNFYTIKMIFSYCTMIAIENFWVVRWLIPYPHTPTQINSGEII